MRAYIEDNSLDFNAKQIGQGNSCADAVKMNESVNSRYGSVPPAGNSVIQDTSTRQISRIIT